MVICLPAVNTNVLRVFHSKIYKAFLKTVSILKTSTFITLHYVVETVLYFLPIVQHGNTDKELTIKSPCTLKSYNTVQSRRQRNTLVCHLVEEDRGGGYLEIV